LEEEKTKEQQIKLDATHEMMLKSLKTIQELQDKPEARDLAEMKLKDEEYNKMSQDFESSLKLGRTTSGEHVVMKHEKQSVFCFAPQGACRVLTNTSNDSPV